MLTAQLLLLNDCQAYDAARIPTIYKIMRSHHVVDAVNVILTYNSSITPSELNQVLTSKKHSGGYEPLLGGAKRPCCERYASYVTLRVMPFLLLLGLFLLEEFLHV